MYGIKDVCKTKQNCSNALLSAPIVYRKLSENDFENVNLLMTHTMNDHIRPFLIKTNAFETYTCTQTYLPQGSEQRVDILESIKTIASTDIEKYVHGTKAIKAKLIFIDPSLDRPKTKALA